MSFLALLFALLIEQARPLSSNNWIYRVLHSWIDWVAQTLDAGEQRLAWRAWSLAVMAPTLLVLVIHWALMWFIGWPVAMLWSMVVMYATLGFRQFSHHFTDIRDALEAGDEALAQELVAKWRHVKVGSLSRNELLRHVIEYSALSAHRHVFGVLAWFSILAAFGFGPAGAVLYRMSAWVKVLWNDAAIERATPSVSEPLQTISLQVWQRVDWAPARLTALAFAVVGNFEEAVDCWRNYAQRFPDDNDGVVLAATSGAIGVRLGGQALPETALSPDDTDDFLRDQSSESTPGREPEMAHLTSLVGLVWRSVVMWMVLLALLTLARLLG
jgi:adenosylcobinamide-phosphate synthase